MISHLIFKSLNPVSFNLNFNCGKLDMKKLNLYNCCWLIVILVLFAAVTSFVMKPKNNEAPKFQQNKKKIVFIAGACSHGPGQHEHKAGCMLLAKELNKHMGQQVEAVVYQGWPSDTTVLNNAAAIVMYMDGGGGHLALKHMTHLNALVQKGTGIACLHYAVEFPKETGGPEFKEWLGGYFEPYWSVNPHWMAEYKSLPKHPVTSGVSPFSIQDEWYYHMRFREGMQRVTPLLTAVPPPSTLERKDGPHEGNEYVRKAMGQPQHMAWVTQRPDGGRGFGFTGGHYHKNWQDKNFRKLVLNAIVWTAKLTVPSNGVPVPELSQEESIANLDTKPCPK